MLQCTADGARLPLALCLGRRYLVKTDCSLRGCCFPNASQGGGQTENSNSVPSQASRVIKGEGAQVGNGADRKMEKRKTQAASWVRDGREK